jgi:hypothetical protein
LIRGQGHLQRENRPEKRKLFRNVMLLRGKPPEAVPQKFYGTGAIEFFFPMEQSRKIENSSIFVGDISTFQYIRFEYM